jgi:hypothetical protein
VSHTIVKMESYMMSDSQYHSTRLKKQFSSKLAVSSSDDAGQKLSEKQSSKMNSYVDHENDDQHSSDDDIYEDAPNDDDGELRNGHVRASADNETYKLYSNDKEHGNRSKPRATRILDASDEDINNGQQESDEERRLVQEAMRSQLYDASKARPSSARQSRVITSYSSSDLDDVAARDDNIMSHSDSFTAPNVPYPVGKTDRKMQGNSLDFPPAMTSDASGSMTSIKTSSSTSPESYSSTTLALVQRLTTKEARKRYLSPSSQALCEI